MSHPPTHLENAPAPTLFEPSASNATAVESCLRSARLCSLLTIFYGLIVLAGWGLRIQVLTTPIPAFISMKANTALAFVLAGVALWFARTPRPETALRTRRIRLVCGGLTLLIGLLTLGQYATDVNFGIDEALFRDVFAKAGSFFPGRMAPGTATAFCFIGLAMLTLDLPSRRFIPAQWLTVLTLLIGLAGLLGYFYGAPSLYRISGSAEMALPTTMLFIFLSLGTLAARPTEGLAGLLTSAYGGGTLARRFLPAALALPLLLNAMRVYGEKSGLFGVEFGIAIFAVLTTVVFAVLLFAGARFLNRMDAKRHEYTEALRKKDLALEQWAGEAEESARRFRFLADTVPEIIWTSDPAGSLDYHNQRWLDYTGLTLEQTADWGWGVILHPEDHERCFARFAHALKTEEDYEIEYRLKRASDGAYRWHLGRAVPMRDAAGRTQRWVGTCTDIDDQKKSEEALRESEKRFLAVLENISEGLVICQLDGELTFWNSAGLKMHQFASLEEARRKLPDFADTFELRSLDGELIPLESWPLSRIFRGEQVRDEELHVRRLDLPWDRIFSYSGAIVQGTSANAVAFVTISDITVRKKAEEALRDVNESLEQKVALRTLELSNASQRLQTVFDAATDVSIIACDVEGRITVFNLGAEKMLGYRSEEMLGEGPAKIHLASEVEARARELSEEVGEPIEGYSIFVERVRRGKSEEREWTYVRKDGSQLTVTLVITASHAADGTVNGFLGVAIDITERKMIEAQLLEAKEAAEAANKAKSRFLANMSHEIRTPMNGVIGMTSLLLGTRLNPLQRDYAETIRLSGENLLGVINGILDFSKIEAGKIEIERVDFDLEDVVNGTLELLAEAAQGKGLELTCFIDPVIQPCLRGDPGRLRQVLINLLGNAIKFTARGEVDLRVELEHRKAGLETLRFQVRDTGIGISPAIQANLFQAFTQADVSTTRRYGGTGLGLAISRQLVETMGGEMNVSSVPDEGSTFSFSLPFEKPAGKPAPGPQQPTVPDVRVLIADDNLTSSANLHAQLTAWKFAASLVRTEEEALAALRDAQTEGRAFTLVMIDQEMPGMDGVELARLIKADPSIANTHLLLLTSRTHPYDEQALREIGIFHSCLKPVRQSILLDNLMNVFNPAGGAEAEVATDAPAIPRRSERILMAEDNAVNQKLALAQLHQLGYEVDAVGNGSLAVEALRETPYDIVLMDCHMPEMDGYEATSLIRQQEGAHRHTWIIAMTANAMAGDREKCLTAGMDDYVNKPVRIDELSIVLDRARQKTARVAAISPSNLLDLRNVSADENFLPDLIKLFLEDGPATLLALRNAVQAADLHAVIRAAHTLKGSSSTFGAHRLQELCQEVELAAKEEDFVALGHLLETTTAELENVTTALTSELSLC